MYLEKEAETIVRELKRAGADNKNYRSIMPETIAPVFAYLKNDIDRLYKVLWKVEKQMG